MSWKVEPAKWLAPPDSSPSMPLAADPLDKQAMAAMSEPIAMLDEHALLRAEAAADAHISQAHMQTAEVAAHAPPSDGSAHGAAIPKLVDEATVGEGPSEALEVELHRVETAPAPLEAEAPEDAPEEPAAPDELQVSLTPTMGHAVTVTPGAAAPPEASDADAAPGAGTPPSEAPVGLFIPTLTAPPEPEPEPEPELVSGASISGEFSIPSPVIADEPEPEPEEGAASKELTAADSGAHEIDAEDVLEMEDIEEDDDAPEPAAAAASTEPEKAPPSPPPEPRRRRHWADAVFQDHYLTTLPEDWKAQADADVEFILSVLELAPGSKILDVGCGNGRHVFALADHGHEAIGIDNSLAMLLAAGQNNERREHPSNFLHADMRELPKDVQYDAVVCLGSTYGYFEDEVNKQVLVDLRQILKPGGKLVIQVFNRDYLSARLPCRSWWASKRGMIVDEAEMNYFANRLRVHRTIVVDDGRNFEHYMFMKAFTLHDLGKLLSNVGFKVREVSGSRDTRGRFYGSESPDIWIVAERLAE